MGVPGVWCLPCSRTFADGRERIVSAAYVWVMPDGHETPLCARCCAGWRVIAEEEPEDFAPARIRAIESREAPVRPVAAGEWWLFEEPPAHVLRVRSDDMRDIIIRDRNDPSLWAWVRRDGTPIIPPDGVTQADGLGWLPWLELNLTAVMYDDEAGDAGKPAA